MDAEQISMLLEDEIELKRWAPVDMLGYSTPRDACLAYVARTRYEEHVMDCAQCPHGGCGTALVLFPKTGWTSDDVATMDMSLVKERFNGWQNGVDLYTSAITAAHTEGDIRRVLKQLGWGPGLECLEKRDTKFARVARALGGVDLAPIKKEIEERRIALFGYPGGLLYRTAPGKSFLMEAKHPPGLLEKMAKLTTEGAGSKLRRSKAGTRLLSGCVSETRYDDLLFYANQLGIAVNPVPRYFQICGCSGERAVEVRMRDISVNDADKTALAESFLEEHQCPVPRFPCRAWVLCEQYLGRREGARLGRAEVV